MEYLRYEATDFALDDIEERAFALNERMANYDDAFDEYGKDAQELYDIVNDLCRRIQKIREKHDLKWNKFDEISTRLERECEEVTGEEKEEEE